MIKGFSLGEWCEFFTLVGTMIAVTFFVVVLLAVYQRKKLRDMQLSSFTLPLVLAISIAIGKRVTETFC